MGCLDCWLKPILFLPLPLGVYFWHCSTVIGFPSRKGMGKGNPLKSMHIMIFYSPLFCQFIPNVRIFGVSLNPGPFSLKEHVLVTIMATVGGGCAYPYILSIVLILTVEFSCLCCMSLFCEIAFSSSRDVIRLTSWQSNEFTMDKFTILAVSRVQLLRIFTHGSISFPIHRVILLCLDDLLVTGSCFPCRWFSYWYPSLAT